MRTARPGLVVYPAYADTMAHDVGLGRVVACLDGDDHRPNYRPHEQAPGRYSR